MLTETPLVEELFDKIKTLNERLWDHRANRPMIELWLKNFANRRTGRDGEELHALFLLSHFMYFAERETRVLLRALYRDLFRYSIVMAIRERNSWTQDVEFVDAEFERELSSTRFLGLGNPAESGTHLLYYFRQENDLPKDLFVHTHQLFDRRLDDPTVDFTDRAVRRLVFLDDFCGTGQQALEYSAKVLPIVRQIQARERLAIETSYLALFATVDGIGDVRRHGDFDVVGAVTELDMSYKTFGSESRYFKVPQVGIDQSFAEGLCRAYGDDLLPGHPLGYRDSQLMLGFRHNVPDNTLPVFWSVGVTRLA